MSVGRDEAEVAFTLRYNDRMSVNLTQPVSGGATYAAAGVDIDAANSAVERMKAHIASTRLPGVLSASAGNFGGMFALSESISGMSDPVLVSSIDGVGTKLKLAFATGRHRSIAGDLVRHSVNDILVQGAKPLLFLDYFATGKLDPDVAVEVVAGMSDACRETGCVLIGGETAEMPGMYSAGEYDLAGTIIGIVDRSRIVDGNDVCDGDIVIGLASDGLHTNGYSLAQHILLESGRVALTDLVPGSQQTYADSLTARHRCYAPAILKILATHPGVIRGMAHITGGGLVENLPRTLPKGLGARIDSRAWPVPPIFSDIERLGSVARAEMYRVFNMGIGFVVIARPAEAGGLVANLLDADEKASIIGTIECREGVLIGE